MAVMLLAQLAEAVGLRPVRDRRELDYCFTVLGQIPPIAVSADPCRPRQAVLDLNEAASGFPAVVAHRDGWIKGALTYEVESKDARRVLTIHVIWTDPEVRRQGLARQLLWLLLDAYRPRVVQTQVVSVLGLYFMEAARRAWPNRRFVVHGRNRMRRLAAKENIDGRSHHPALRRGPRALAPQATPCPDRVRPGRHRGDAHRRGFAMNATNEIVSRAPGDCAKCTRTTCLTVTEPDSPYAAADCEAAVVKLPRYRERVQEHMRRIRAQLTAIGCTEIEVTETTIGACGGGAEEMSIIFDDAREARERLNRWFNGEND